MEKKTLYGVTKTGDTKQWSVWTEGDTVFVEHGKLGGKMQTKTTKCKTKNVGRSNETSPEQQAELEAQSKWNKQWDKYYRETIEDAESLLTEGVMLAQDYTKHPNYLDDEFYVSMKLDGIRVKTLFINGLPEWHSRGGKTYPVPEHLVEQLAKLHKGTGVDCLDGEAYIHGMKLQKIQSCVKKHNELTSQVTYQIFDIPELNIPWCVRKDGLNQLKGFTDDLTHVDVLEQTLAHKDDLKDLIKDAINQGYEGLMMRNLGGEYLFQNQRSNDLLKYKLMQDSECKVIGCSEDKNGQGLFEVEWNGVTFSLSMNGSQEENSYNNLKNRIGDWVNFKYQDVTEDGVPTFARGLYFRECSGKGEPLE